MLYTICRTLPSATTRFPQPQDKEGKISLSLPCLPSLLADIVQRTTRSQPLQLIRAHSVFSPHLVTLPVGSGHLQSNFPIGFAGK